MRNETYCALGAADMAGIRKGEGVYEQKSGRNISSRSKMKRAATLSTVADEKGVRWLSGMDLAERATSPRAKIRLRPYWRSFHSHASKVRSVLLLDHLDGGLQAILLQERAALS